MIAEVFLMIVTLIAGVALGGFVFSLLGSYSNGARVSAQVVECTKGTTNLTCTIVLANTGTSSTVVNDCTVDIGGASQPTTLSSTGSISHEGALEVLACVTGVSNAQEPTQGSQAAGEVFLGNGGTVPFAGTWT